MALQALLPAAMSLLVLSGPPKIFIPPKVELPHGIPGPRFGYGAGWARERHLRREARSILRADAARGHVQGVGINPLQLPSALSAGCEQIPLKLVHLREGTRQKLSCGRLEAIGTGSAVPDPQQPHGRCRHRGVGAGERAGAQQHPDPPSSKPGSPCGAREDAESSQSHLGTASCSGNAGFPPKKGRGKHSALFLLTAAVWDVGWEGGSASLPRVLRALGRISLCGGRRAARPAALSLPVPGVGARPGAAIGAVTVGHRAAGKHGPWHGAGTRVLVAG